jgi:hypothetical protein
MLHIRVMEKSFTRIAKPGRQASLGRASDGVVILRPAVGPKHFTQSEIEKTVDAVRDARSGRFIQRDTDNRNRKGR